MNDKIVPIRPPEETMTNTAKCLLCHCTWIAVVPVGTVWLECPGCKLLGGRFIGPIGEPGMHWICGCGNDLFYVKDKYVYCGKCGVAHER
jgi:hypothetical protein